jgi:hypothetical protein
MANSPKRTAADGAREFALDKYRLDRAHELELNRATVQYELESLKVLSYLNGGAAALYLGLLGAVLKPGSAIALRAHAPPIMAWAIGLFCTALAIWLMLESQVKFTQAYHGRRRAEEKRRFDGVSAYDHVTDKTENEYEAGAAANRELGTAYKSHAKLLGLIAVLMFCFGLVLALIALTAS